jgi:hypothetical protein
MPMITRNAAILMLFTFTVPLFAGCAVSPVKKFANQEVHLENSRRLATSRTPITWKPRVRHDFSSAKSMEDFTVAHGEWEISDGKLRATGGDTNRVILLARSENVPLRIEMDVTNVANADGSLGDITVLINTDNSDGFFSRGYTFTTGSYYNNCTTLYRSGRPLAKTEYSPVVSGAPNKVVIEVVDGHIRYWLNGMILLEAWDRDPLVIDPELWIGIRTWNTLMAVESFAVFEGVKGE